MLRPFAADDAALHVVGRDRHDRHGALGDEVAGQPLDGDRDDLLGLALGLLLRLLLDQADLLGGLVAGLVEHIVEQRPLGLVAGHRGDLLETFLSLSDEFRLLALSLGDLRLALAGRRLATRILEIARFERLETLLDRLFLALNALLDLLDLATALLDLSLSRLLRVQNDVLRLDLGLLADDFRFLTGLIENAQSGGARLLRLRGAALLPEPVDREGERACENQ